MCSRRTAIKLLRSGCAEIGCGGFRAGSLGNRSSGSVSTSNVVVNHASRGTGAGAGMMNNSTQQTVMSAAVPAPGTIETLPMLKDVPMAERQSLFLRKLQGRKMEPEEDEQYLSYLEFTYSCLWRRITSWRMIVEAGFAEVLACNNASCVVLFLENSVEVLEATQAAGIQRLHGSSFSTDCSLP
ncbi:hypothetical protein HAX54_032624 [Datura stramonium]|uniref:Uncharacterized protein n=1 Tax=Datura stramonium TaxID=4076 RepID=A0ABS8VBZ8_DATST|nr:hypothetical protein [Datura stramonium]